MSCEGWTETLLGDVTNWASGGTPSKSVDSYWGGEIPWISANVMKSNRIYNSELYITMEGLKNGSRLANIGSVLLLVRGSELHKRIPICKVMRPVAFNQDVKSLLPKSDIDTDFLLYWLLAKEQLILNKVESTGIGAGKLDTKLMMSLEFSYPPLPEQIAIARILSSLDDKIELNKRMNKTLEEMAQAIFKRWFVDFEFPDENGNPYKSSGGKMVESELGLIPEGWSFEPIKNIVADYIGGDWGKDEIDGEFSEPVGCIRGADFPSIATGSSYSIPLRYIKSSSLVKRHLEHGDIVLEISGGTKGRPVGRTVYINHSLIDSHSYPIVFSNFCRLVRCKTGVGLMTYLYIQNKYFEGEIEQYQVQSTGIANFQFNDFLENFRIIVPNSKVLNDFNNVIEPLFTKINCTDSTILAQLRDTLLPKLMSGEIRVPISEA